MKVYNDLKTRGVADILIAVTDGLKGMAETLAAAPPGVAREQRQSGLTPVHPTP